MSYQNEIWKDVVGLEGQYQVSNYGRVKSLDVVIIRSDGKPHPQKGKVLKQSVSGGYYRVCLNRKSTYVHHLIAKSFLGHSVSRKSHIDHINSDKLDNRLENIRIVSVNKNIAKERSPKSGFTGVYYRQDRGNWYARIRVNGKYKFLGSGNNPEKLHRIYLNELKKIEEGCLI